MSTLRCISLQHNSIKGVILGTRIRICKAASKTKNPVAGILTNWPAGLESNIYLTQDKFSESKEGIFCFFLFVWNLRLDSFECQQLWKWLMAWPWKWTLDIVGVYTIRSQCFCLKILWLPLTCNSWRVKINFKKCCRKV